MGRGNHEDWGAWALSMLMLTLEPDQKRRRICAPCRSQKTWFAHTQCGFHAVCQNNFQIFCRSCCAIEIRCWARKCQKSESSPKNFFLFFFSIFFLPELDRVGFPPKRRRNPGRDGVVVGGSNPEGAGRTAVRGIARVPSARRRRVGGRRAGAWTRDLVSLQVILGSLATRKAGQPLAHKRCAGA